MKPNHTLINSFLPSFLRIESPPKSVDRDLQKIVSNKNKEIEKLNTECLELETQCESLKLEVKEAWEVYKTAQEKAMARETELLDELKEIGLFLLFFA